MPTGASAAGVIGVDDLRTRAPVRFPAHQCSACGVRAGGVFGGLDPTSLVELERLRHAVIHPSGTVLFEEGDSARAIYCLCSGRVKLSSSSEEGRAVILGIAVPGDVLGIGPLLLGTRHDMTAETLERVHLCMFPRVPFLSFLECDPRMGLALARRLSGELSAAYRQVRGAVLKQSSERLAEVLLALCETHGRPVPEGICVRLNLSQEELAALIGVSRRSLNRGLAKLRGDGIIESRGRSILVRNCDALRRRPAALFSY